MQALRISKRILLLSSIHRCLIYYRDHIHIVINFFPPLCVQFFFYFFKREKNLNMNTIICIRIFSGGVWILFSVQLSFFHQFIYLTYSSIFFPSSSSFSAFSTNISLKYCHLYVMLFFIVVFFQFFLDASNNFVCFFSRSLTIYF